MYARYIPPPKPAKATASKSTVEQPSPAPSPAPAPSSSAFSPATPYARYVPPARNHSHGPSATPTLATRAPPPSKTHLNAAAIPPPESLPAKIVFNYDDDDDNAPSPPKKRKLESPEPVSLMAEGKRPKQAEEESTSKVKREKKEKRRKGEADTTPSSVIQEGEEGHRSVKRKRKEGQSDGEAFAFAFDENMVESEQPAEDNTAFANEPKGKHKKTVEQKFSYGTGPEPSSPSTTKPQPVPLKAELSDNLEDGARTRNRLIKSKGQENQNDIPVRHRTVLEKAAKSLKDASKSVKTEDSTDPQGGEEPDAVEAHGLEPLPQPELVVRDGLQPSYETLPHWIANPVRVAPQARASFTDLGVSGEAATKLEGKGYKDAFAVQTAVMPLLLPSRDRQGDVVVSAATGSGKTLSYVLPMIQDIGQGVVTRLRGLIVVPTRELVMQAKEVCEICASAFGGPNRKTVKIGVSMGNKQFELEQADLVEEDQRFDPEGYQVWQQEHYSRDLEMSLFNSAPKPLVDHVLEYASKVDILICTPGRLVDHINRTAGFSLEYVRWLVVDEADKLLAQTFQEWLSVVMPLLNTIDKPGSRDFSDSNKSGVQKVVLSATMTRDLSLLNGLKLFRPKLVALEGVTESAELPRESTTQHVLPESLEEFAVKIRDPDLKPLYLVDLLSHDRMALVRDAAGDAKMTALEDDNSTSAGSDSESDASDSCSDSSDKSDSDSEESNDGDDDDNETKRHDSLRNGLSSVSKVTFHGTALIFTKSNETAMRLSRLLCLLSPGLSPLIGTLTSTTRTSERRKTLRAFAAHRLRILVASDLVARGIDLANLYHVINYDMPTSVASYVHRVGRTARANGRGKAWTLFTKTEAGWFWTAIAGKGESKSQGAAGTGQIKRSAKVEEVRVNDRWEEDRLSEFERALEKLGEEASEMRRKR